MVELNSPMFRTPNGVFFSPSPRRRGPVLLSCHNKGDTPQQILRDNDDEAEKRRTRMAKATSNTLSPATPRIASRLDSERSNIVKKTGLTDLQMKDVYSNCIKLSSENKINSKNAFGLHLIDYMQDLIKTLKEGEMTNFQVASCTLDASAKIYAGRVDSIHAQAYKMLGGLGRADENADQGEGADDDGKNQRASRAKKKAANYKPGNTIEKNLKNINVNQFDLEFEVDPLFQKTSAAFDEGGSSSLLLNHLFVRDDSCDLLLDSSVALTTRDVATSSQTTQDCAMMDLSEFRDMFSRVNFDAAMVCPHFADFEFTKWNKDGEADTADNGPSLNLGTSEHAFDMNAPASETACEYPVHVGGDYSDDDIPDTGGDMEFGGDGCYQQGPSVHHTINTHLAFTDGQSSTEGTGTQAVTMDRVATTLGNLCLELSQQPSEYSYYKSGGSHLATWAGPEHWKRRNAFPKGPVVTSIAGDPQAKKKRGKKQVVKVDFGAEHNFTELSKRGKASNTLSKSTLQKLSPVNTTLPEDCPCNFAGYNRFFVKRKMMVKRVLQERTASTDGEEGSEWYNYNNADDCANFCPRLQDRDDDDDDDNVGGPAVNTAGPDSSSGGFASQDLTYDLSSQALSFGSESVMDQTMFTGDGLVAQPNKVQKININYASTAKKVDVKRLKAAIWNVLTTVDEQGNKENIPIEQRKNDKSPTTITVPKSFKDLYSQLSGKVSKHMAKNLSVHIAYVCVLHLANEKCLKLVGNNEMSDFTITQAV